MSLNKVERCAWEHLGSLLKVERSFFFFFSKTGSQNFETFIFPQNTFPKVLGLDMNF